MSWYYNVLHGFNMETSRKSMENIKGRNEKYNKVESSGFKLVILISNTSKSNHHHREYRRDC
jgi:hypothetical protein